LDQISGSGTTGPLAGEKNVTVAAILARLAPSWPEIRFSARRGGEGVPAWFRGSADIG
jgi:hypothetical protein